MEEKEVICTRLQVFPFWMDISKIFYPVVEILENDDNHKDQTPLQ